MLHNEFLEEVKSKVYEIKKEENYEKLVKKNWIDPEKKECVKPVKKEVIIQMVGELIPITTQYSRDNIIRILRKCEKIFYDKRLIEVYINIEDGMCFIAEKILNFIKPKWANKDIKDKLKNFNEFDFFAIPSIVKNDLPIHITGLYISMASRPTVELIVIIISLFFITSFVFIPFKNLIQVKILYFV